VRPAFFSFTFDAPSSLNLPSPTAPAAAVPSSPSASFPRCCCCLLRASLSSTSELQPASDAPLLLTSGRIIAGGVDIARLFFIECLALSPALPVKSAFLRLPDP
jgi:hypothetical protein